MEASKSYQDPNPIPNLPQEIIFEILSWLPVKSLLKFRRVCKSWLSLISTSQFIKTHLKKSTEHSKNYANHTIVLGSSSPVSYYTCSLDSLLYHTSCCNPIKLNLPMIGRFYFPWIIGCCNGLLCLSVNPYTLILYNPSLGKFKKLPFSGTYDRSKSYITYGFGYNELNDDYKVAELRGLSDDGVIFNTEMKIYSLRNDSWRKIKNYPDGPLFSGSAASVCGKLHWLAPSGGGAGLILALDMAMEEYDEMRMFECEDGEVNWCLMDSGGSLCTCGEYYRLRVDVWVMKEYGVQDTWTRLVSVPYPVDPRGHLRPVFVSANGDILFNYEGCVMLFKSRDGAFETLEIRGGRRGSLLVAAPPYIKSLVPPYFDELS